MFTIEVLHAIRNRRRFLMERYGHVFPNMTIDILISPAVGGLIMVEKFLVEEGYNKLKIERGPGDGLFFNNTEEWIEYLNDERNTFVEPEQLKK